MAALVLEPSSEVYSRLLVFEEAVDRYDAIRGREKLLEMCRGVIERHGLSDVVGVDIKHVHFAFAAGTVLVERQDPAVLRCVMKPEAVSDVGRDLTPFAFVLVEGVWVPYEFVADCPLAAARLAEVVGKDDFLIELGQLLAGQPEDVTRVLGFHVLHRDFLDEGRSGTVETPGAVDNELLLRGCTAELQQELQRDDGRTRQVLWSWSASRGPKRHDCIWCQHNSTCTSHCRSHK